MNGHRTYCRNVCGITMLIQSAKWRITVRKSGKHPTDWLKKRAEPLQNLTELVPSHVLKDIKRNDTIQFGDIKQRL